MSTIQTEVTMELLSDLRTALETILKQTVPSLPVKVTVEASPRPRLVVEALSTDDAIYPNFIRAKAILRPTAHYRRLLGLPEGEL